MQKLGSLIILFFALFVSIAAQEPQSTPPTAQDDGDVVKISTNLIQFDVTVTNKNGEQITDLKPEDFEVFENGKSQEVTNLSYVSVASKTKTDLSRTKQQKNKSAAAMPPPIVRKLNPNEVRRTIALVVDDFSISFAGNFAIKDTLKNFVNNQMQPNDLVAIIRVSGGSGVFQQFTSDKRILFAAIDKIKPNVSKIFSFAPVTNAGGDDAKYIARQQSNYALGAMGAVNFLIKSMDKLPGRKALILFSEGFRLFTPSITSQGNLETANARRLPSDPENPYKTNADPLSRENATDTREIYSQIGDASRGLTESANRAGVVINTVDTRGLVINMFEAGDSQTEPVRMGDLTTNSALRSATVAQRDQLLFDTQSSLIFLAEETGGRAFINNNNFKTAVEKAVNDQNGYYLLGYQPEEEIFDVKKRKFNKVEIRLKNRPELKIKYRSGFFGVADNKVSPDRQTPGQELAETLFSPFDASEVDINLTPIYFSDAKLTDSVSALLYIAGKDLAFTKEANGTMKGDFEVLAYTFDTGGKIVDKVAKTYSLSLTGDSYQKLVDKGLVYMMNVPMKKPGGYQLKVAFRDTKNGKVGSASQFIEVPNRKKENLVLSGLLLQNYTSETLKKRLNGEDSSKENTIQMNTAVRQFKTGTILAYVYEIYNAANNASRNSPLQSQARLFRDNQLVFEGKKEPISGQNGGQKIQSEGLITLGKNLAPGSYVLQISVTGNSPKDKNQSAAQYIDFEISQ